MLRQAFACAASGGALGQTTQPAARCAATAVRWMHAARSRQPATPQRSPQPASRPSARATDDHHTTIIDHPLALEGWTDLASVVAEATNSGAAEAQADATSGVVSASVSSIRVDAAADLSRFESNLFDESAAESVNGVDGGAAKAKTGVRLRVRHQTLPKPFVPFAAESQTATAAAAAAAAPAPLPWDTPAAADAPVSHAIDPSLPPAGGLRDLSAATLHRLLGAPLSPEGLREAYTGKTLTASTGVNQDRLEWLGDAQWHAAVSAILFDTWRGQREGALTQMRTCLSSNRVQAHIAVRAGIVSQIAASVQTNNSPTDAATYMERVRRASLAGSSAESRKLLADTLEALVGLVYTELGEPASRRFVHALIGTDGIADPEKLEEDSIADEKLRNRLRLSRSSGGSGGSGQRASLFREKRDKSRKIAAAAFPLSSSSSSAASLRSAALKRIQATSRTTLRQEMARLAQYNVEQRVRERQQSGAISGTDGGTAGNDAAQGVTEGKKD